MQLCVPELAANLVDPLDSSYNQLLEIELRSNAHVELHVEVVVVRHEWAGSSTAYVVERMGVRS